jgi:hypothetical protein
MAAALRVVIVKPSKYAEDGFVERFRRGFMPNSTVPHLRSMTPESLDGRRVEVLAFDEYVEHDLGYLAALEGQKHATTLLALVGVQSHQLHRALDLAALARRKGVENCIIGGPHPMTCDTAELGQPGISFALGEAETLWPRILVDALGGTLRPSYGGESRWQAELRSPVLKPPSRRALRRYVVPMVGIYPARGCPYACNFCSVIKIAGHEVRSQPVETTLESLRKAKEAGVKLVMFTSDNFNKYAEARTLLSAMAREGLRLPFFVQCDTQIAKQEDLVALLAEAGCFQIFVGVESFDRKALLQARKGHNHPEAYRQIVEVCRSHGITTHFSNILGFPSQGEDQILDHLRSLKALAPDAASFYILTPIPGTEQYDEFLEAGLITERNLDRFDGSRPVWRHPRLGGEELTALLFRCCREFYDLHHVLSTATAYLLSARDYRLTAALHAILGHAALSRLSAARRSHPMAGGVGRLRLDRLSDYAALRRETFGLDLVPLPKSLPLSRADEEINRRAKLPLPREAAPPENRPALQ